MVDNGERMVGREGNQSCEGGWDILLKGATKKHVLDALKLGETHDLVQLGVVDNGQIARNGLEEGERDVGELVVVDERDGTAVLGGTDAGKVGSLKGLEVGVGVKLEAVGNLGESGGRDALDVGHLDLLGSLKLRKVDLHVVAVVGKDENLGDVDEVGVELGQSAVVVDGQGVDLGQVKTANVTEEGIGNVDGASLLDTRRGELEGVELAETVEVELVDLGQGRQLDGAKQTGVLDGELAANGLEGGRRDGEKVLGAVDNKVLLELLGAVDDEVARQGGRDGDLGINGVTVESRVKRIDGDIVGGRAVGDWVC